ncbi:GNAT family N-acetyltransferase [Alcanivorax sp.]|uniref:GNAT family N-acetyltransferase n=1 Tax=Alcanivorax sp. TaxID=1872427 RepID=UPI000C3AD8F4|nr:GNAT family N-acetyltransferase [Alcanivorax sp.]MBQ24957.1 GNAT family N-acetyltransferase [Alcanivorax sp.]|tara:strand:+ start:1483 stop:1806 length:324 start_codon:yes stop_codon:yes gene_type:complete
MPISVQAHPLSQEECQAFAKVLRDAPQYRQKLADAVADGHGRLFAAHFNGQRVAIALIEENQPQLAWMVVHPATQGRGVGKDFLRLIGQQLGESLTLPEYCQQQRGL